MTFCGLLNMWDCNQLMCQHNCLNWCASFLWQLGAPIVYSPAFASHLSSEEKLQKSVMGSKRGHEKEGKERTQMGSSIAVVRSWSSRSRMMMGEAWARWWQQANAAKPIIVFQMRSSWSFSGHIWWETELIWWQGLLECEVVGVQSRSDLQGEPTGQWQGWMALHAGCAADVSFCIIRVEAEQQMSQTPSDTAFKCNYLLSTPTGA